MPLKNFAKTTEFKLFLTVWIVYIFYLQMYGSSCMANSQSALTASIMNEQRFEVDTYYKTSCDVALYKGHYYSGQPPGISFLAVPFYAASKPFFSLLPEETVNSLYNKIEKYGEKLPVDYWGKKKILSNYFTDLSKRQILEYIIISGFALPAFTTALFGALFVVLFYIFLKRFTKNEKSRILISLLFAFGTSLFPSSELFYERPIAIAFMFAAFFIIFRIKHNEIKPKSSLLFLSGLLAGLSAMFDYFHAFASGLLFLYLLSLFIGKNKARNFWIFSLDKKRLMFLLSFIVGVSIPAILLASYHYAIFDDPLKTSYSHRIVQASDISVSDVMNIMWPSSLTLFHMLEFILYTPVILVIYYSLYRAFKKNKYQSDAKAFSIFIVFTLIYAAALALVYPVSVAPHFRRHMMPTIPYAMLFLPFILGKENRIAKKALVFIGALSVFINWVHVQSKFDLIDFSTKTSPLMANFIQYGPSSQFLSALSGIFGLNSLIVNLIGLALLGLVIFLIWRKSD